MSDDRDRSVQELFERQRLYRQDPWKLYPIFLPPCRVRILMVTDSGGSFGLGNFGLKALLDILNVSPGPWVQFEVTKAHRRTDPDADLQNFLFDNHDLSQYDQIWMFAVERSGSPILTDSELRAVSEFMDGGGGVFATGDHEDLGVAMCGRVPRVRSMRKWYWPNPGPNGEPVAPKVDGPDRYDTLSEGNDPDIQMDDQSDDIPQRITPRLYSSWSWPKWFHRVYPHPLLCGPRGVIRVLPDHPHEGDCYEPSDLSASFTFDGYTIAEYPAGLSPEVIAWSTIAGRMVDANKGLLNPRTFGAIGAYDGHRVDVGRVVVDATWHHFFNVNLIGELGNLDPIKGVGFDATTTGHAVYEDIKSYFRNIAVWLARPSSQACMWWRILWWLRWHHIIVMDLRPQYLEAPDRLDLGELVRLGGEARDVLGRVASQCTLLVWFGWQVLRPLRREMWDDLERYLDPWLPGPAAPARPGQEPVPDFAVASQAELLLDASLGGLVYAVAQAFPEPNEDARLRAEEIDWSQLVGAHLERTVDVLAEHLDQTSESIRGFRDVLGRRGDDQPTG